MRDRMTLVVSVVAVTAGSLGLGFAAGCERGGSAPSAAAPGAGATPSKAVAVDAAAVEAYLATCSAEELARFADLARARLASRLLDVDPKLAARYRAVTEQAGAGIHRMLQRGKFEGVVPGRGGGAYFSFTTEKNDYDSGPDLELQQWMLSSGFAGRDSGVVLPIDAKAIADVTLADVPPFMLEQDAQTFCDGSRAAFRPPPARVGHTYLVRSVRWNESDLVAAFEVVDRDDDGITFVWRVLKEHSIPMLVRPSQH